MPRKTPQAIQQYRGNTEQHATYTGPIGELTVDTDKKVVVVQDGATAGGIPMAREDRKVAGDAYIKVNNAAKGTLAADLTLTMDMTKVAADLVSTDENNGLSVGTDNKLFANGIISVPEYEGATASSAGTSGLVPPAAAGQQDMVLTGSGKWVVPPAETFRLSMIGVPRYWRSTTLPAGHVWANGDLALFADWPELKKIYDAGGFAGMLLAYNANSATIAANLGKWRPNAANPTGLYVPNLSEQFFRGWTGGAGREAGSWQQDAVETGITSIYCEPMGGHGDNYPATVTLEGNVSLHDTGYADSIIVYMTDIGTSVVHRSYYINQRQALETRPVNIAQPSIIYLGLPA